MQENKLTNKDIRLSVHRNHKEVCVSFLDIEIFTQDELIDVEPDTIMWLSDLDARYVSLQELYDWGLINEEDLVYYLEKN